MREILFRGKRVDNGEWIEGWYGKNSFGAWPLRDAITPCVDAGNGYLHYEEVIPETVGQYTGMTANGKRIFEGGIVRGRDALEKGLVVEGYIDYQYGSFCIVGDLMTHFRWMDYEVEVIGNIHDNPELIGGKEDGK